MDQQALLNFKERHPIERGWSGDRKYRVLAEDGKYYLYRVSDKEQYERKRAEFEYQKRVYALGVPMCAPIAFGLNEEGTWSLQSFIEGRDAEEMIPTLSRGAQYAYGLAAGRILKRIHRLKAPKGVEDWSVRYGRKIDRKLELYASCPLKYEQDGAILSFIEENRHLIASRPQVMQHGDYHIGNMMIDGAGVLHVIDFNRFDYGDPYEEFNRIVWCAGASAPFAAGMVDGYFDSTVPESFFRLLALYISVNTLSSLPWAIPFGEGEIETMRRQARAVLSWYGNLTKIVPSWYENGRKELL